MIGTAVRTGATFTRIPELVLRVYSKDIEFQAQPVLRFDQFAEVKTDLNANPGDGITFFKYNNLSRGGALTEGTPMETQALAGAQVTITVQEYGNAVSVTEFLIQTSFDDVMSSSARLLGFDYATVLDELARDTLMTSGNEIFANDRATEDDIVSGDILSVEELKDGVELLATNLAPKIGNDHWVCFVHPHQSRGLRDDDDWITVARLDPQRLYNGEIGRIDDIIFIETTQLDKDANENATPADVYTAIMIGGNAFGKAVALNVEMRDNGIEDFKRQRSLAWYNIMGEGVLNEDNIVLIKTA